MSISTTDKYAILVEKIYELTVSSELKWNVSPIRDGYSAPIGDRFVEILEARSGNDENDIVLAITDKDGNVLDSFNDVALADAVPRISGFRNYYFLMSDLLKRAGRVSSGAEDVLDNVLNILGVSKADVPMRNYKKNDDMPF